MESPLLSVCLITYNHANYIRQAIDGVLMQKVNFSWELIIADDFSTDGTREIIREYKGKYPEFIKLILQEKNVGPAQNWIDLITCPKSKYIAYFEGDDYWTNSNKLQKQFDFLESNPEYAMCFHKIGYLSNEKMDGNYYPIPKKNKLTIQDIIFTHYIPTCSLLFRNECFPKPFPCWFINAKIGDIPLEILIASKGLVYFHNEVMAVYRKNPTSITHNNEQKRNGRKSYLYVFRKLNKELKYKYVLYFYFKILLLRLGYIKDYLGLNKSLK